MGRQAGMESVYRNMLRNARLERGGRWQRVEAPDANGHQRSFLPKAAAGLTRPAPVQPFSPTAFVLGRSPSDAVRLQLLALASNLGNFLRTLATPEPIKDWSLTSLKEKLIKIGAKVVSHGRYVAFQMAEVAAPRTLFAEVLRLIGGLRPRSPPLPAWRSASNYRWQPAGEVRV